MRRGFWGRVQTRRYATREAALYQMRQQGPVHDTGGYPRARGVDAHVRYARVRYARSVSFRRWRSSSPSPTGDAPSTTVSGRVTKRPCHQPVGPRPARRERIRPRAQDWYHHGPRRAVHAHGARRPRARPLDAHRAGAGLPRAVGAAGVRRRWHAYARFCARERPDHAVRDRRHRRRHGDHARASARPAPPSIPARCGGRRLRPQVARLWATSSGAGRGRWRCSA